MLHHLVSAFQNIADVADGLFRKLKWFLLLSAIACAIWISHWLRLDLGAPWLWLICAPVVVPLCVWLFILYVLHQLKAAPELMHEIVRDEEGAVAKFSEIKVRQASGLRSLVSTIRTFREQDGMEVVFETLSGLSLFANPLFLIVSVLMFFFLCALILLAPLLIIF